MTNVMHVKLTATIVATLTLALNVTVGLILTTQTLVFAFVTKQAAKSVRITLKNVLSVIHIITLTQLMTNAMHVKLIVINAIVQVLVRNVKMDMNSMVLMIVFLYVTKLAARTALKIMEFVPIAMMAII
jgi:hypothetical protein